ncbi:archaellin/type IV pilin N-terminal domain-containing protein [Halonotius roseus]|uniref:Flagellin n=1 Tax=Halonotius roseus TaxID=2511997 RepID=A0A544QNN4_9EURY|nr:archaellin/type IV pilin N-terminal domain-containing protein [Halonotius roseus]TQQ80470.1 flagellin [Halonotius roseus]
MFSTASRGQVGIGTLIVFIAMVLVAAIAAGVLINTAGLLQAQAQSTGEETTAQVSDRIAIGEAVGYSTSSSPAKIDTINITMRLAAGADPINLSKASYTIDTDGSARVIQGNEDYNNIEFYQVQGLNNKPEILAKQEDLMAVEFDIDSIQGIDPIEDGDDVTFIVQAPAGGSTYATLRAPGRIDTDESYILS